MPDDDTRDFMPVNRKFRTCEIKPQKRSHPSTVYHLIPSNLALFLPFRFLSQTQHATFPAMAKKKAASTETTAAGNQPIIIKRYGNRRLYNTETKSYVNYQELLEIIRAGHDIQVIDSSTKADVTKAVLVQLILEEEKNENNILPLPFLFQLIRSREGQVHDFFSNYLSSSFEAYLKTKEEFDRRFKGFLEMTASAPQMWEKLIPGADMMKEFWGAGKKDDGKK
jgi:polyhydroxyalkanoate synthesis repressor PhaR